VPQLQLWACGKPRSFRRHGHCPITSSPACLWEANCQRRYWTSTSAH
jgi:hypothetical protein